MTGSDFDHAATPVTWSLELRGVGDHVLVAITVLSVAPKPLWAWVALIQPLIALIAMPWFGTVALTAFAVLAVAPAVIAWWLALRQQKLRYTVSPTRGSLRVRDLRTEAAAEDGPASDAVDLHDVDEIAAVPLRGQVAVRFRRDRTEETKSSQVVVVVPADRWPGVAAAFARAGVSLPWDETADQRLPFSVLATIAVSAGVPIAGIAVGTALVFRWLLLL